VAASPADLMVPPVTVDSAGMASAGGVLAAAGAVVSVGDLAGVGAGPTGGSAGMTPGGNPTRITVTRTAAIMNTDLLTHRRPSQTMETTIPTGRRMHRRNRTTTPRRRAISHGRPSPHPAQVRQPAT